MVSALTTSDNVRTYLEENLSAKLRPHAQEILQAISEMGSEDPSEWNQDFGLINRILSIAGMSDAATNQKTVIAGINKIAKLAKGGLIVVGDTVTVPSSTLDRIMASIDGMHQEMVSQSRTDFPPMPRINCKDCQYFQVCTKEIILQEADEDERAQ